MKTPILLLGAAATIALAGWAGPVSAIVPPKDCGFQRIGHKRYNIKADQLRCRDAVPMARAYLAHHTRPRGYRCHNYTGGTSLKFRCERGIKVFFAIRR
jgi:hypothetical protein